MRDELPTDQTTTVLEIVDFEEVAVDEVLGSGEEDLEVSVGNDSRREEIFLIEDMADGMIFAAPVVESVSDAVSRRGI